jgi:hypothetical protein
MNIRKIFPGLSLLALITLPGFSMGQETIQADLARIAAGEGWVVVNRGAELGEVQGKTAITFDARQGDGAAWLEGVDFHEGTIEVVLKGKNVRGRSFVGVAFRGVDHETYDAIYFRPFNWLADNDLNRSHGVQYISHPENPWARLREEHTGVYENEVPSPPDPDSFFKARIEIQDREIRVFVEDATEPCLVVSELTDRVGGRVGLWMGNGSDGSFAELTLRPGSPSR